MKAGPEYRDNEPLIITRPEITFTDNTSMIVNDPPTILSAIKITENDKYTAIKSGERVRIFIPEDYQDKIEGRRSINLFIFLP